MQRDDWLQMRLETAGYGRRDFLKFCSAAAAVMALPRRAGAEMAAAIELKKKPSLVWLEFQDSYTHYQIYLL